MRCVVRPHVFTEGVFFLSLSVLSFAKLSYVKPDTQFNLLKTHAFKTNLAIPGVICLIFNKDDRCRFFETS